MNLSTPTRRRIDERSRVENCVKESACAASLERVLEWVRLLACHVRRNASGIETHRKILIANGETHHRLQEFDNWRESPAFTEREKTALRLTESLSLKLPEAYSQAVLKDAKRHFNRTEMVRLTLSIMAINDWISHHGNSPARILVVEGDSLDRNSLRAQLQKAHMEDSIIFVPDPGQAMAVLNDYRSGRRVGELIALLVDLRMPGMGGIELFRRVRAMRGMENLPLIAMTSSHGPQDMEECKRLKVLSYVEKPVTFCSFSKAIANIFHQTNGVTTFKRAGQAL